MDEEQLADTFDLVILGCGPAGEKAAAQAAYFGKRVAVVEAQIDPGGAAVHTGTLPSKTLRETAIYLYGFHARRMYGVTVELTDPKAAVPELIRRKQHIQDSEVRRMRANLDDHGVELIRGWARITSGTSVMVATPDGPRSLTTEYILIATGSKPYRPPHIRFEDHKIHDSDEVLCLEQLPATLTVLGGGVIGCEYACMFAALGVKVHLVDGRDEIMPFLDREILGCLHSSMEQQLDITFHLGTSWGDVVRTGAGPVRTELKNGEVLETEELLFAAGRAGNTADIGLGSVGMSPDRRGYVPVNENYQTQVPNIYAAGDVVGFPALASVSMEQARVAACHMFGLGYKPCVAAVIPYGIYTIPEVSAFGETEESAIAAEIEFVVGRSHYRDNARGLISGDLDGMTKLVVCAKTRKLIGVHVVGERATELVHIGQTVMHFGGTVDTFIEMVFNYPTLAESFKYAAYDALGQLEQG